MNARHGLALPAAVFTLAVIALFIAGTAFTATQEIRASVGTLAERLALEAAEYGAAAQLRDWDRTWSTSTPVGHTLGPTIHTHANGAVTTVRLTRTSLATWWVMSEGTAGGTDAVRTARRTVNAFLRLELPPDAISAALGVADSASVTAGGAVIGSDSVEVHAACTGMSVLPIAGVASRDTNAVIATGSITGVPPVAMDSAVAVRVATLSSLLVPDVTLPPGAVVTPAPVANAGVCDTLAVLNWGDPAGGPCHAHRPVIVAQGDVTIRGGTGHGTLMAAGDVTFESGASFSGLVVAGDDFVTGAGGGSVLGAVLAGDARRGAGDHSRVGVGGVVRRASCQVRLARLASAPPVRVRERWWAEY